MNPCESWRITWRERAFSALRAQPDACVGWWAGLSKDRRRALLAHVHQPASMALTPWGALPSAAAAALRHEHARRAALFGRLRVEFEALPAF
jgi:hypothetical protein